MRAHIVVGLGFGDEGKGTTVDHLCSLHPDSAVVRFNGGHQATHTVIRDGIMHRHSSYGSGTLLGRPTYISEHCCFYPPSISGERNDLLSKGIDNPALTIHPLAKVTTPYDIAYNRMRESRLKHGSTGVGIGATFDRNVKGYKLHAMDIAIPHLLNAKLEEIRIYYSALLRDYNTDDEIYYDDIVKEEFKFFYASLANKPFKIAGYEYLKQFPTLIFEGAQGIMLDMDYGMFPNVTYSNCTSKNALSICAQLGDVWGIDIHYVTRCYLTRHGNGWMPNENKIQLVNTEHETNILGDWQGIFRIGELDTKILNYVLNCDDIYSFHHDKHLHVTCMDQRPGFVFPYDKLTMPFKSTREQSSPMAAATLTHS